MNFGSCLVHGFFARTVWNKWFYLILKIMKLFCDIVDLWNIILHLEWIQLLGYEIIYEFVIIKSCVIIVIYEHAVL